jgi:hypothetical protein
VVAYTGKNCVNEPVTLLTRSAVPAIYLIRTANGFFAAAGGTRFNGKRQIGS